MASSVGATSSSIKCTNCIDELQSTYIECAECGDVDDQMQKVYLCVTCFSLGAECGTHRRTHDYRVHCPNGVPVFDYVTGDTSLWSSSEEQALVSAAEKYNLGNWDDVAIAVNSKRRVVEVKEHYDRFYLRGRLGQLANKGFQRPKVVDHTTSDAGSIASMLGSPPIRSSVHKISYDDLRLLAYMPHRDDFEKEWSNDAEELVAKLLPCHDDDALDKAVKLAHVEMYVRIVAARRKRKAMARDYDLVPSFFKQEKPGLSNRSWQYAPQQYQQMKRANDLREQMKKFSQLMPAAKLEELIVGLSKQELLKERIEELMKFRRSGITSLTAEAAAIRYPVRTNSSAVSSNLHHHHTDHDSVADESLNSKRIRVDESDDRKRPLASIVKCEKQTTDGIDFDVGKRSSPRSPSQMDSGQQSSLLSAIEIAHCTKYSLDVYHYLLLKLAILKEEDEKAMGIPQRTNIRNDTAELKANVRRLMQRSKWLPMLV